MAKPTFPLTVRRGAVAVKIYYTPVRTNVTPGDADPKKQYDAYTLVYTFGGERRRLKFHDLEEARSEAELAASQIANGQMAQVHLSAKQTGDYVAACQKAQELGFDLTRALAEFSEAKKLLPDVHLVQAAQFYKRYRGDEITDIDVPAAVKLLVDRKPEQGVVGYYLQDLSARLGKFAEQFPGVIATVTTAEIDTWLKSLELEPRTRNNYRAAVLQLFNFARTSLKALPHWLPHAAEGTIRVKEPSKDTEIYLPAEIRQVLSRTRPELAVLIAIRAFSGIRNEELFKLDWSEIDLERNVIKLKKAVTRLSRRRVMPLLPNLRSFLTPISPRAGRVAGGYSSSKTLSGSMTASLCTGGSGN